MTDKKYKLLADNPAYSNDILNYHIYAESLAYLIKNSEESFTIWISWEWWYWKTTLMKLISFYLDVNEYQKNKKEISKKVSTKIETFHKDRKITNQIKCKGQHTTLLLDTWPFINSKDIWESIFEQIMYELIKIVKDNEKWVFKETWKFLIKSIWWLIKTVKLNWKLNFWLWSIWMDFDANKFSMDDMFLTDSSYSNFKISVEEILIEIIKKKWNLLIIVDDLDRLYPKQALEVMLFLKNFLDVKGCTFIIWTDNEVLKEWLEELYWWYLWKKEDISWRNDYIDKIKTNFFEKIYQLEFKLPLISKKEIFDYLDQFNEIKDFKNECGDILLKFFPTLNLRKIKKVINFYNFILQLANVNKIKLNDKILVLKIAILHTLKDFNSFKYKIAYWKYENGDKKHEDDNKKHEEYLERINLDIENINTKIVFSVLWTKPLNDENVLDELIKIFIQTSNYASTPDNEKELHDFLKNTEIVDNSLNDKYLWTLITWIKNNNQIFPAAWISESLILELIKLLTNKSELKSQDYRWIVNNFKDKYSQYDNINKFLDDEIIAKLPERKI